MQRRWPSSRPEWRGHRRCGVIERYGGRSNPPSLVPRIAMQVNEPAFVVATTKQTRDRKPETGSDEHSSLPTRSSPRTSPPARWFGIRCSSVEVVHIPHGLIGQPGSAGVPNLFEVFPQRRQFTSAKFPNKLGTPTLRQEARPTWSACGPGGAVVSSMKYQSLG
jgi:hypothetical protein